MNARIEDEERAHFSDRLKGALRAAGLDTSPSKFIAQFNLRADGVAVTVHGARKWLVGDAIPTQARIQVMADWLGVSAAWLRFGDAENGNVHGMARLPNNLQASELVLLHDMRILSESNRQLIQAIVNTMLRQEKNKDPQKATPAAETAG
jgi:hypothetical protein